MAFSSSLQLSIKVDSGQQFSLAFKSFSAHFSVPLFKSGRGSFHTRRKHTAIRASWVPNSEIASSAFTLGTVAVLPFYTLMIVAPRAKLTKQCMDSSMPYMVLGLVYVFLLYLSWTPATVQAMFASKYLLPELPGIAKLFSNEMTLASAWIHLLAIDLFAARQIFHDGQENGIETRHSVSLCLLSCPVGILSHFITKALTKTKASSGNEHDM